MIYFLRVRGDSMAPTLRDGDALVALSTRWLPVKPGRIVAFRRGEALYIKRALNREGEGWYVVGDNPSRSSDSRCFGPVPESTVRATAVAGLIPPRWLLS